MSKQRLIIDTDTGVDDAIALVMALCTPNVEVVAITTVAGNIDNGHVKRNVCHVLDVLHKDVAVFGGAEGPLFGVHTPLSGLMGEDGLGNVTLGLPSPAHSVQGEHAALALLRMAKEEARRGDFTLVALGPLTNLAMAVRLDASFVGNVPRLVIMGGAVEAKGNTTPAVEFNFFADPEAASIVLSAGFVDVWILPWEVSVRHALAWGAFDEMAALQTNKSAFFTRITSITRTRLQEDFGFWGMPLPDPAAMLVAIETGAVRQECHVPVFVETCGRFGRGMMVVDWQQQTGMKPNAHVVTEIDSKQLLQSIRNSLLEGS